ncbi:MAG: hypothetical protein ACRD3W_24510 [Terriglobales bacterium]
MQPALTVAGRVFTARTTTITLIQLLSEHLEKRNVLTPIQVLILKSWLLRKAEKLKPGKFIGLQELDNDDPIQFSLKACIGKTHGKECFV